MASFQLHPVCVSDHSLRLRILSNSNNVEWSNPVTVLLFQILPVLHHAKECTVRTGTRYLYCTVLVLYSPFTFSKTSRSVKRLAWRCTVLVCCIFKNSQSNGILLFSGICTSAVQVAMYQVRYVHFITSTRYLYKYLNRNTVLASFTVPGTATTVPGTNTWYVVSGERRQNFTSIIRYNCTCTIQYCSTYK